MSESMACSQSVICQLGATPFSCPLIVTVHPTATCIPENEKIARSSDLRMLQTAVLLNTSNLSRTSPPKRLHPHQLLLDHTSQVELSSWPLLAAATSPEQPSCSHLCQPRSLVWCSGEPGRTKMICAMDLA